MAPTAIVVARGSLRHAVEPRVDRGRRDAGFAEEPEQHTSFGRGQRELVQHGRPLPALPLPVCCRRIDIFVIELVDELIEVAQLLVGGDIAAWLHEREHAPLCVQVWVRCGRRAHEIECGIAQRPDGADEVGRQRPHGKVCSAVTWMQGAIRGREVGRDQRFPGPVEEPCRIP